jgi:hypothetical protein
MKNAQTTDIAFVDRPPTADELQRIRLILSTYQDGTGILAAGLAGLVLGGLEVLFWCAVAVAAVTGAI